MFDGRERPSQRSLKLELQAQDRRRSHVGHVPSHWRYVIEGITRVRFSARCHSHEDRDPERRDEAGKIYLVDVEDSSLTLAELANGAVGTIICSWATRVRRDDLLSFQIDGTHGSAVAGLHRCWIQSGADTPTVQHFNPDRDLGIDYRANWNEVPDQGSRTNPYRVGWENFLRHVVDGSPPASDLTAGIPAMSSWPRPATGASTRENGFRSSLSPTEDLFSCHRHTLQPVLRGYKPLHYLEVTIAQLEGRRRPRPERYGEVPPVNSDCTSRPT